MTRPSAEELLDRQEIYDVLVRYCRGIDRRDEALVRSCYQHDAYDDHGIFQGSAADFVTYAVDNLKTMVATMHCIHNVTFEIAGDKAATEAYCVAYHRMPSRDGESDHFVGIRYVDQLDRTPGGPWLIRHRTVVYEWTRIEPVQREWRMQPQFARGQRDRTDVSYRAFDTVDHSC